MNKKRESLEGKIVGIGLVLTFSYGIHQCIYKPFITSRALTKSHHEVFDFDTEEIADLNKNGFLSEEEKRIQNKIYEECRSIPFTIKFSCVYAGDLMEESKRLLQCAKEKYSTMNLSDRIQ